ncbi:MAG: hypothetical protein GX444_07275 [Myxococcales bacterium]|nr:hypothetical protein [Myxococcales bacterium]
MVGTSETHVERRAGDGDAFFNALTLMRKRRRKVTKAKRASEEITYLNIVAMMDMMTIILVFLLKSVSFSNESVTVTQEMTLPYSTIQINPVEAVKVFISKGEITVESRKVAEIHNGTVDEKYVDSENQYLIPTLQKALVKEAEQQGRLSQINEQFKFQGNLTILADQDVPYHIIMQVIYSAGQAVASEKVGSVSFSKYRLMVLRSDGGGA